MSQQGTSRGVSGALVKLWGGGDYTLTVTGRTQLTPNCLRLHFEAKQLLAEREIHPTMWVRGWFPDGAASVGSTAPLRSHQRAYTLVNVDEEAGSLDVDFALHDGLATRWAAQASPGDTLEVTVLGSHFRLPNPTPRGWIIVGDTASLPAINSLLDAIAEASEARGDGAVTPARVFLEAAHDDDRTLSVGCGDVTWIDRVDAGRGLVAAVASAAFDASGHAGWVACDNRTTRSVAKVLREDYRIPRRAIKAQAYWVA